MKQPTGLQRRSGHAVPTRDREEALKFIARQQEQNSRATAYLGTIDEDLEDDLDELNPPWMSTIRVIRGAKGGIHSAVCVDWDDESSHCWIHGPWSSRERPVEHMIHLLEAAVSQAPPSINRFEMFGFIENNNMLELARAKNWKVQPTQYVMEIERDVIASEEKSVAILDASHLDQLRPLHATNFPNTYATPAQLLDPKGKYIVVGTMSSHELTGYAAGHQSGADGYLDYLAVAPQHRTKGNGTTLIRDLAARLEGEKLRLTCDERHQDALSLYHTLGWVCKDTTRSYTLEL